jgi:hypothetical protein
LVAYTFDPVPFTFETNEVTGNLRRGNGLWDTVKVTRFGYVLAFREFWKESNTENDGVVCAASFQLPAAITDVEVDVTSDETV